MREIIQWSSNVGAVKIGKKMGEDGMYKWIKAFGFGTPTGVEFPVESGGIVAPVDQWSGSSIGNIPMGQGIAVTALQMASAFSTVANNGWQVRPRLVEQVGDQVVDDTVDDRHRVIPGKVARQVRSMLQLAVDEGYRARARRSRATRSPARPARPRWPVPGGYAKGVYVASFVGMVPADHPRLVVLVRRGRDADVRRRRGGAGGQGDHAVLASSTWRSRREQRPQASCRAGRRRRPDLRASRGVW